MKFIQAETDNMSDLEAAEFIVNAHKEHPAAVIEIVDGGYMVFETWDAYQTWINQQ